MEHNPEDHRTSGTWHLRLKTKPMILVPYGENWPVQILNAFGRDGDRLAGDGQN